MPSVWLAWGAKGPACEPSSAARLSIGQYPILKYGNEDQRQRYLPASTRGECTLAFGLTEPEAGSNPLEMTSTYRRDGDRFLLSGVKYLISNGAIADAVHRVRLSRREGRSRTADERVHRRHASDTFERKTCRPSSGCSRPTPGMFQMNEHPVRGDNLLGVEGEGFRIAMGVLISGRLSVARRVPRRDRRLLGRVAQLVQGTFAARQADR